MVKHVHSAVGGVKDSAADISAAIAFSLGHKSHLFKDSYLHNVIY